MTSINLHGPAAAGATYRSEDDTSYSAPAFLQDVICGLSQTPKQIPCKYFYDARGAELFTQICRTPEYYVTRTELALLDEILPEVADLIGRHATIIEYGAGEARKIRNLLSALREPQAYVPVDISAEMLLQASHQVKGQFPQVAVHPVIADYTADLELPEVVARSRHGRRMVFFPGSTISNFTPGEARRFLRGMHSFLRAGDGLLLGVDLLKSPARLHAAYNDQQGITAEFNLNLLRRINRELHADFDLEQFEHYACFNPAKSRIEMHLVSLRDQTINIGRYQFQFAQGETLHTENSYKYSLRGVAQLGADCGFETLISWTDREQLFSLHYLVSVKYG